MRIAAAILLALFWLPPALAQDEPGFTALSGVPVMEGLEEAPESLVVFDKAEGRIIQATLRGDVGPAEAAAFYREALFQLGWKEIGASGGGDTQTLVFAREGERLTAELAAGPPLEISFSLGPAE